MTTVKARVQLRDIVRADLFTDERRHRRDFDKRREGAAEDAIALQHQSLRWRILNLPWIDDDTRHMPMDGEFKCETARSSRHVHHTTAGVETVERGNEKVGEGKEAVVVALRVVGERRE